MKTINYTGSSKLIARIVNLLNRKAPLPLDGDGDPDWGSNGQVLSTDGNGNTAWVNQGGGGSGGHTIENTSGADLPQEDNLQFVGVYTRDDSVNSRTEVNIVRQMTKAQMQALSSAEKEGFIDTTDEDDDYIPIAAEDVKRGVSDVDADLTALENGKVNRSGDTMTGNLYIDRQNGTSSTVGLSQLVVGNNIPSGTAGNSRGAIVLYGEGTARGAISAELVTSNKSFYLPDTGGTLCVRTVTTLVNETANIAASGNKTYAALTATALQAYDEIHFLANFGNVFVNGTATKEQMQNITAYTSPANGRLWFFAAGLSASTEYSFRIRADSNGLQIINGSASLTLNNLRIDGVKYN